ncbi:MAG: hypothetical protein F4Y77_05525 [Holophagales bacterium]|nr:hypothetical protein [Holophagales bacterium]
MSHSSFARTVPLLATLLLACNPATDGSGEADPQEFDVVFQGARVIDPERRLDEVRNVGIRGDVIAALTEEPLADSLADGGILIDAAGLVLAPGFVDLHAHGQGPRGPRVPGSGRRDHGAGARMGRAGRRIVPGLETRQIAR